MSKKFDIHSPQGKKLVVFCVFSLLFSATVLLLTFDIRPGILIPSESRLEELRREEKKTRASLRENEEKIQERKRIHVRYQELLDSAWQESEHGSPDVEIPKLINQAAGKYGVELNGVLTVRRSRVNNELSVLETDVNAVAVLGSLLSFLQEFQSFPQNFSWKRADFRPEMTQNSDRIFFGGTLRVFLLENPYGNPGRSSGK